MERLDTTVATDMDVETVSLDYSRVPSPLKNESFVNRERIAIYSLNANTSSLIGDTVCHMLITKSTERCLRAQPASLERDQVCQILIIKIKVPFVIDRCDLCITGTTGRNDAALQQRVGFEARYILAIDRCRRSQFDVPLNVFDTHGCCFGGVAGLSPAVDAIHK